MRLKKSHSSEAGEESNGQRNSLLVKLLPELERLRYAKALILFLHNFRLRLLLLAQRFQVWL